VRSSKSASDCYHRSVSDTCDVLVDVLNSPLSVRFYARAWTLYDIVCFLKHDDLNEFSVKANYFAPRIRRDSSQVGLSDNFSLVSTPETGTRRQQMSCRALP
jgi:hypothetical protein